MLYPTELQAHTEWFELVNRAEKYHFKGAVSTLRLAKDTRNLEGVAVALQIAKKI